MANVFVVADIRRESCFRELRFADPPPASLLVACRTNATAHHSFAPHFDASKPVNISGTVKEFEARNPHSYLHIAAVDENGRTREYVCESHGVTQLTRNGITPQLLKAGTKIRVTGSLSRHSPYMCFFDSVEFADGRMLNVNGPAGRSGRRAATLAPRKDIFGTWLLAPIAEPEHERSAADDSVADAGRREGRRRLRSVQGRSRRSAAIPSRSAASGARPSTPLEIVRDGDDVVLHHEWMDVRRVIHMNMKTHPKDGPRSSLGHSIGHWEGDTLVIETGKLFGGRAEPVRRATGPADQGPAALGGAHVGRAAAPRRRAPASRRRDRSDRPGVLQAAVPARDAWSTRRPI